MPLLREQTIAVVGLGGIGRKVAEKLAALGTTVIGVHRRQVDAPGVSEIVPNERLAEVLAYADGVVMAVPGTTATEHLLSRDVLAAVRHGITVVNVGRGSTIDQVALIEALWDGRVGFAALDVFEVEPLPSDSALWSMPNVLLSPHVGARHEGEDRLIAALFARNAKRLLDGEPLINAVNTVEFY
jgi:phosphoglycerate dehydrogenase-like enzyme